MQLKQLQQELETVYDLSCQHQVNDFLLTERAVAGQLVGSSAIDGTPEALLVRQDGDGLDVSLFLEAELLARLEARDPSDAVDGVYLNDLLAAVEGVSHFLYLIWNAGHARPVTQLELELQAEVDKFVVCALVMDWAGGHSDTRALHRLLFSGFHLRQNLSPQQRARYLRASRLAACYCDSLPHGQLRAPGKRLLPELRRFYRMLQGHKIRHIQSRSR